MGIKNTFKRWTEQISNTKGKTPAFIPSMQYLAAKVPAIRKVAETQYKAPSWTNVIPPIPAAVEAFNVAKGAVLGNPQQTDYLANINQKLLSGQQLTPEEERTRQESSMSTIMGMTGDLTPTTLNIPKIPRPVLPKNPEVNIKSAFKKTPEVSNIPVKAIGKPNATDILTNKALRGDLIDYEKALNSGNFDIAEQISKMHPEDSRYAVHKTLAGLRQSKTTQPVPPQQTLYHGSKSAFDKFDISKFGTGEGADKFGKGAYLTDSRELAEFYANAAAKKDFIERYTNTGIFGTPEPVYKPNAEALAKANAKVNEFVKGDLKLLDAETYKVDQGLIDEFRNILEDTGMPRDKASQEVNYFLKYARENKDKINNYRGELDYLMSFITEGKPKATDRIINKIKDLGYEGIKYPSDKFYEGAGGYNYVIYNPEKLLPKSKISGTFKK